jgi:hypothetical protein
MIIIQRPNLIVRVSGNRLHNNSLHIKETSLKSGIGHTQGETSKRPAKDYISIQKGVKLRKPSILMDPEFYPVVLFS